MATNDDIAANNSLLQGKSCLNRTACASYQVPRCSGQMWSTMTHSKRSNSAMKMLRIKQLERNRPNILAAHWLATIQRRLYRESSKICNSNEQENSLSYKEEEKKSIEWRWTIGIPFLEHHNFVFLKVFHVDLFQQILLFLAETTNVCKHLCMQEIFIAVERVISCFECLMM